MEEKCVCGCDKPEICRISSLVAEAAKKASTAEAELAELKSAYQKYCIPESERLILKHTTSDNADPDAPLLAAEIAQIVNAYLSIPIVHEAETAVGVTAADMQRKIRLEFKCAWTRFAKDREHGYAWIEKHIGDVVYIDVSFLTRWKNASLEERRRIELLIGWKVIHELAHLGYRWRHGQTAETPEKFGYDAGDFVEEKMLGGLAGIIFGGSSSKWDGTQEVLGLCITRGLCRAKPGKRRIGGPLTTEISEDYVRRAHEVCASEVPAIRLLLPVDCSGCRCVATATRHLLSSPAADSSSTTSGSDEEGGPDSDEPIVPYGPGRFRVVPCCGLQRRRPNCRETGLARDLGEELGRGASGSGRVD